MLNKIENKTGYFRIHEFYIQSLTCDSYVMHKFERNILQDAKETAEKSNMRVQHGCVIVDAKGNIISRAYNKYQDLHKINYPWTKGQQLSCHAEENALKQVDRKKLDGAKLYVVRISYCGEFMNSKPCERCTVIIQKFMNKYGLKNVYYSQPKT